MTSNRDLASTPLLDTPRGGLVAARPWPAAAAARRRRVSHPGLTRVGRRPSARADVSAISCLVITRVDSVDVAPAAIASITVHRPSPSAPAPTVLGRSQNRASPPALAEPVSC